MNTDYGNYAKVINDRIVVRYSVAQPWGDYGWPLDQAREFADFIRRLADDAERDNPRVRQLADDLKEVVTDDRATWTDIALALFRKGYRR